MKKIILILLGILTLFLISAIILFAIYKDKLHDTDEGGCGSPDKSILLINISHNVDEDCSELRYSKGILVQKCDIIEHWKIEIRGEQVGEGVLLERLMAEKFINTEKADSSIESTNRSVILRCDSSAPYKTIRFVLETLIKDGYWKILVNP